MRYLSLALVSICLFIAACKKKNDQPKEPVNPYAWVDDYCGKYNASVRVQTRYATRPSSERSYDTVAYIVNLNKTAVPNKSIWGIHDSTSLPQIELKVNGIEFVNMKLYMKLTDTGIVLFNEGPPYGTIINSYLDYKLLNPATSSGSTSIYITGYKAK